jgi:4-aminobutyrate aminotransferase-like enzyme
VPDLMTMAKSLAGGMPLSGVVGRAEIMDAAAPGGLGGTYAGNPLAVASAHAVLEIIDEEKLCERAVLLGDRLKAKLVALQGEVGQIADVRGPGAMVAVEFCKAGTREPDAEFTRRVQARALERGLLLLVCGVYSNVVRFLFPLTIQESVFDEALAVLDEVVRESVGVGA